MNTQLGPHETGNVLKQAKLARIAEEQRPVRAMRFLASTPSSCEPVSTAIRKRLHFIRHGQGFHNLMAQKWYQHQQDPSQTDPSDLKDMEAIAATPVVYRQRPSVIGKRDAYMLDKLLDPTLTPKGVQDAEGAQATARLLTPQLVVVSPLRRATQTALIAFEHLTEGEAKVPFVAHELLREGFGEDHICDKRKPRRELMEIFPNVDYTHVVDDVDDELFSSCTDSLAVLVSRAYHFLLWLAARPETDIVVSTHSTWLLAVFNGVLECQEPKVATWFATGELRSVDVDFVVSLRWEPAYSIVSATHACVRSEPSVSRQRSQTDANDQHQKHSDV